jgi:CheY-like chemotaxis protein
MHHLEHLVRPSSPLPPAHTSPEHWSAEQAAAIAAAEAIAMAAAADVAAEAAATAQVAVEVAVAAAVKAADRARDVAAAARAAADAVSAHDPSAGNAGDAADAVARRVETVAAAAAVAVVEAASVIGRQLAADATAAAQAGVGCGTHQRAGGSAGAAARAGRRSGAGRATAPGPPRHQAERPVFVADTDPAYRRQLGQSLSSCGLSNPCLEFADGDAVIDALQHRLDAGPEHLPSLVLLDDELAGTSGADVLAWMARTQGLADTPVIVLSASADAAAVHRAYRLGARSYLVKPVGLVALAAVTRDLGLPWMLV